jgi:predicted NBD/HSP70 family sugar kinase
MASNDKRVISAVTASGVLTRAELGTVLGLSRATVTRVVDRLLDDGALREAAGPAAGPGRPAKALRLAEPARIGVLTWAPGRLRVAVGTAAGELGATNARDHDGESLDDLLDAAAELLGRAPLDGVVFGVPAPFRPGAGLPPIPELEELQRRWPAWLATDPTPRLRAAFGVPAAIIENDANLGALGERHAGASRGVDTSVYIKLGAHAVGAGLIVGGRLHRGAAGFAGELAHVQVRPDGPPCVCGGRGCLISVLRTDLFASGSSITELAAVDEPAPRRFLRDVGRMLGRPLADLATLLNPGAIVVDGALGAATGHVAAGIREAIDRHAAPTAAETLDVRAGALGEDAELSGGLHLWREHALAAAGISA